MAKYRGKPVLEIRVEFQNGLCEKIIVHEEDEPEHLATSFCSKYKLDDCTLKTLTCNIEYQIDLLISEELKGSKEPTSKTPTIPKQHIYSRKKHGCCLPEPEVFTFKPAINRKSRSLTKHRTHKPGTNRHTHHPFNPTLKPGKFRRIHKVLFELFSDNQKTITTKKTIEEPLRTLLSPLIDKVNQTSSISFQEFSSSLKKLLRSLPLHEKTILVQQVNLLRPTTSVYERQMQYKSQKDLKLSELRKQSLAKELTECTFQPNVLTLSK
mmetsp:Transcript_10416/g.15569  ORF Transcript_10416/g.15569 Transcript_10416/m.15569 type:complete len:267 (+) Transcript_10416:591-1391(+)